MEEKKKTSFKERLVGGLIYAVVGTVILLIIEYIRDMEFNVLRTLISFVLFWAFGYFIFKRNDKKRID